MIGLPGLPIEVAGPPSPVRDAVEAAFGFCAFRNSSDTNHIRLEVRFLDSESESLAARVPGFLSARVALLEQEPSPVSSGLAYVSEGGSRQGSGTVLADPHSICAAWSDSAESLSLYVRKRRPEPGLLPSVQALLIPLLRDLLLRRDACLLHAGSVRTRNDEGLLVLGDNGAGKTTAVLALARAGGALLADDLNVLRRAESDARPSFEICAVPEAINLTEDENTARFFPELAGSLGRARPENDRPKVAVAPDEVLQRLGATSRTDRCFANGVLILDITPETPSASERFERLPAAQVLPLLLRANVFAGGQSPGAAFANLAEFVETVPGYRVRTGPDPAEMAREILNYFGHTHVAGSIPGGRA